jgi:hypothetical protein
MATAAPHRFDRTLRTVMWLDGVLSVALVVVCVIACPVVATVPVAPGVRSALGLVALVCALLLAGFGAITAVAIMLRMQSGQYLLPPRLRLPLPAAMRPNTGRGRGVRGPTDRAGGRPAP